MHKVFTHLWFNREAGEAIPFYISLFEDSGIDRHSIIRGTPSGDADVFDFHLAGVPFQAINGGPFFKMNASISLMVHCDTAQDVDRLHAALAAGGSELIPLGEYPFSARYAWVQDRFGLSWQLMLSNQPAGQKIVPSLLFSGAVNGKAEEAMQFYARLLPSSSVDFVSRYGKDDGQAPAAQTNYLAATLCGARFSAMDNHGTDELPFNEGISLVVLCEDQQEVDRLWAALSASPEHEACGWLKDRYGLSWQIVPRELDEIAIGADGEYDPGVAEALLQMKKLDIAALKAAKAK